MKNFFHRISFIALFLLLYPLGHVQSKKQTIALQESRLQETNNSNSKNISEETDTASLYNQNNEDDTNFDDASEFDDLSAVVLTEEEPALTEEETGEFDETNHVEASAKTDDETEKDIDIDLIEEDIDIDYLSTDTEEEPGLTEEEMGEFDETNHVEDSAKTDDETEEDIDIDLTEEDIDIDYLSTDTEEEPGLTEEEMGEFDETNHVEASAKTDDETEEDIDIDLIEEDIDIDELGLTEEEMGEFDFDLDDISVEDVELEEMSEEKLEADLGDTAVTTTIPIPIPFLGTVELEGKIDIINETYSVSKTTKEKTVGPIVFEPMTVSLSNKEGLNIKGGVSLFGKRANLTLEYLRRGKEGGLESRSNLALEKPFNLPISPWKKIPLQTLALEYSPVQQRLYTKTTLAEKDDVEFAFNLAQQYANLTIQQLRFSHLLPFVKDTPFDAIAFNDIEAKVEDIFGPPEDITTKLKSTVDLTGLSPDFGKKFKNIQSTTTISSMQGFKLEATMNDLELKTVGIIRQPKLLITTAPARTALGDERTMDPFAAGDFDVPDTSQNEQYANDQYANDQYITDQYANDQYKSSLADTNKPTVRVEISGQAELDIPFGIGKLNVNVTARFARGVFSFFVKLPQDFTYENVSIKNPSIMFATDGTATLRGEATILDFSVWAQLKVAKVKDAQGNDKRIVSFEGKLKTDKPFKPFEQLPVPGFKDLVIDNVRLRLASDKTFQIGGQTTIRDLTVQAFVKKTKNGIALLASLKSGTTIVDLIPEVKGTVIEQLGAFNVSVAISSARYYDRELGVKVRKGLSLIAEVQLKSPEMEGMNKFFKGAPENLKMSGTIGASLADMFFSIAIPIKVDLSKSVSLDNAFVELGGVPPAISASAQMTVRPQADEELLMTARLEASPTDVNIAGTMQGTWNNPLGIKGFSLTDVAAEVGYVFGAPFPSLGITAQMAFGRQNIGFALKATPNLSEIILWAYLNRLYLSDIVEAINKEKQIISADTLPVIGLEELELYIAPRGGNIGEIYFDPGFTIKGKLKILDFWALTELSVGLKGIVARGGMSKINIGPLAVTGKGFDKKYGTEDDGPVISLEITAKKQEFFISGRVNVIGIQSETDILINKEGFSFMVEGKLGNMFLIKLEAKSIGEGKDLDFWFRGEMQQKFVDFIKEKVLAEIQKTEKDLKEKLTKTQNDVKKIDNDIANTRKEVNQKKQAIKKLENIVAQKTKRAKREVATAQQKVAGAKKELKKIDDDIAQAENRIKECQKNIDNANMLEKVPFGILYGGEQAVLWGKIKIMQAGKELAKTGLKVAKNFLKEVEKTAFDPSSIGEGTQIAGLGTEIGVLEAKIGTFTAARNVALGVLAEAKKAVTTASQVVTRAVKIATETLNIRSAVLEGSLRKVIAGKMPTLDLDMVLLGKEKKVKMAFDFSSPKKAAESVALSIAQLIA